MLEVKNLFIYHGSILAVKNLSLHVAAGELITVLGANGAGKSTLLGTLAGLYPARQGEIYLNGRAVTGKPAEYLVRQGLVLVPEQRQVFSSLSVRDNLLLGAYHRYRKEKQKVHRDLKKVFELFPALGNKKDDPAGALSGGLQQMLAIGRGLMAGPQALMLDEPSVGLAPLLVREIMNVLSGLKKEGKTIILVEQNIHLALKAADRAYIMETGKIIFTGTPADLNQSTLIKQAYLGEHRQHPQRPSPAVDKPALNTSINRPLSVYEKA